MRSLDLRLLPIVVGLWVAQGITIWAASLQDGGLVRWSLLGVAIGLGLVATVAPPHQRLTWLAVGFAVAVGVILASMRLASVAAEPLTSMAAQRAVVAAEVVVKTPPKYSPNSFSSSSPDDPRADLNWYLHGDLVSFTEGRRGTTLDAPVLLTGSTVGRELTHVLIPGSRIRVSAAVEPGDVMRGTAAVLRATEQPSVREVAPGWQVSAHKVRASLSGAADGLAVDPRGLLPGLVVGDESKVPTDLRDEMQAVGLSHLTAVSGANLAIVAGAVLLVARLLRINRRLSVGLSAVAMFGFVVVAGFQPSVLRAAFMGSVALLALFLSTRRSGVTALVASAFLLLLIDPWMSVSLGFALSVSATGGLLIYARSITGSRIKRSGLPWLRFVAAQALGIAAAAQIATMPLIAAIGGGVPLAGVPANVIAAPAVPFATILGAISAVTAMISQEVGRWFAVAAGYPTGWIASTARWSYELPFARLEWPDGIVGFATCALLSLLAVCAWRQRSGLLVGARAVVAPNRRPVTLVAVATLTVLVVWVNPATDGWPVPEWVAVVCDVGQGDAIVVRTHEEAAIVVDVGPDPEKVDRCLSDLGVTTIDLLVLTHFHLDHVGGLTGALSRRHVARVLVSPLAEPSQQSETVGQTLAGRGVQMTPARPGEQGSIGAASYELLWPSQIIRGSGSDPNNASVTLLVEVGDVAILLTGDLEPPAQQSLIDGKQIDDVDVVKVPHHGSRNQADGFVGWVGAPSIAAISVGVGNAYGHPATSTMQSWQGVGALVVRTDQLGDVALISTGDGGAAAVAREP